MYIVHTVQYVVTFGY